VGGDGHVDVDDRLGWKVRHTRRSDVFDGEYSIAQCAPDAVGQLVVLRWPAGIGIEDVDPTRRWP
jgi:hypothetical protein